MSLSLLSLARRGWVLRAASPEEAADILLTYEPALGAAPEGQREASYPGVTDRAGTLARQMIELTPTGPPGRVLQWGM